MKLTDREWKSFYIGELFDIKGGTTISKTKMSKGSMPFIGASRFNNGVTDFVEENISDGYKDFIGLNFNGSVGDCFYHPYKCLISGDVKCLQLKNNKKNKYVFLFILTTIKQQKGKYGYGYKFSEKRMFNQIIYLPVNSKGDPDYDFMEEYIKEKESALKKQYKEYIENRLSNPIKLPNKPKAWKEFFIENLAEINSGKDIYDKERIVGNTPYITSTAQNNGIGYFISNSNNTLESKCLSLNRNGSIGYCFYHPYKALYSNDCRKLRLKYNSKYVGIFISNVITAQKDKYSYGYKMGTGRIKRQKVMLPVTEAGNPDYEYMENYIKYLEQKRIKEYMDYINK